MENSESLIFAISLVLVGEIKKTKNMTGLAKGFQTGLNKNLSNFKETKDFFLDKNTYFVIYIHPILLLKIPL